MKNFCSLAIRIGGLLFGTGLFVAGTVWLVMQSGLFMEPWDADRFADWLRPTLAFGGALMGIGAQGIGIGLVLRCCHGAFKYAGLMVGLKEAT